MDPTPKLRFPPIKLRARRRAGQVEVWDALRGMWLVLTAEEWVRRHLVAFLITHCGAQVGRIVQEYPVDVNGQPQRADVVVVDGQGAPWLLAECKAPGVAIDSRVMAQAVRYNSVLRARYTVLTNGLTHRCFECREGEYVPLDSFPCLGAGDGSAGR